MFNEIRKDIKDYISKYTHDKWGWHFFWCWYFGRNPYRRECVHCHKKQEFYCFSWDIGNIEWIRYRGWWEDVGKYDKNHSS